jgi:hypothetical protein
MGDTQAQARKPRRSFSSGCEEDPLARIKEKPLQPSLVWDQPPGRADDLGSLLSRATERLGDRRLLIVVDHFEEFLILANRKRRRAFQQFLSEKPSGSLTFLLVFRPEYEGLITDQPWPRLLLDTNRKVISPFTENAARGFMSKSGLRLNGELTRAVLREAAEIEQTVGLIRAVTINNPVRSGVRTFFERPHQFRGGLICGFLRESLTLPEPRYVASTSAARTLQTYSPAGTEEPDAARPPFNERDGRIGLAGAEEPQIIPMGNSLSARMPAPPGCRCQNLTPKVAWPHAALCR